MGLWGHHLVVGDCCDMVKHYTKPINRLRQKLITIWEDVYLWYLNTPIPLYWNFHIYRWWIRLSVFAFVVLIIWAV